MFRKNQALIRLTERVFALRRGELRQAVWAAALIFTSAASLIVARAARDVIFLSRPAISSLPFMYVLVAIAMAAASSLYGQIADRWPKQRLIYALYPLYAFSLVGLHAAARWELAWYAHVCYVHCEIVVLLAMIQAWTFVSECYDARQAKRVFGFVGAGSVLAGVVSGFGVQALSRFLSPEALLLVSAALLLAAVPCAQRLGRVARSRGPSPKRRAAPAPLRLRDPYLLSIGAVFALTAFASALADYLFKVSARQHFAGAELASFFGLYYGASNLVMLVYSLAFSGRALPALGVRNALLVLPLQLLTSSLGYVLAPGLWMAAAVKFGDNGLRYTIHNSALQVLFLPLDRQTRGRLKAFMEGAVKPLAGGLAGLALMLISSRHGAESLVAFALALAGLAAVWAGLTPVAARGYLKALLRSLAARRVRPHGLPPVGHDATVRRTLLEAIETGEPKRALYALDLAEELGFGAEAQRRALGSPYQAVLARAVPRLARVGGPADLPRLRPLLSRFPALSGTVARALTACGGLAAVEAVLPLLDAPGTRAEAAMALLDCGDQVPPEPLALVTRLAASPDEDERVEAARILVGAHGGGRPGAALRRGLARDPSARVRAEVLPAVAACPDAEGLGLVLALLLDPRTKSAALRHVGVFPDADRAVVGLYSPALAQGQRHAVIAAAGRLETPLAAAFLARVLEAEDASLRLVAARGLTTLAQRQVDLAVHAKGLLRVTHEVLRELLVLRLAREETVWQKLPGATALLRGGEQMRLETAFALLGAVFGPEEMARAYWGLGETGRQGTALEIVDGTVRWPGKRLLLALIERDGHSLAALHADSFGSPPPELPYGLLDLRDRALTALTLLSFGSQQRREYVNDCRARTYSPEPLVHETARWCLRRLEVDTTTTGGDRAMETTIEKVLTLKSVSIFSELQADLLAHIAETASEVDFAEAEVVFHEGDEDRSLFVILEGSVGIERDGGLIASLEQGTWFGEMALLDGKPRSATAVALEETRCLRIDHEQFYEIVADNPEIVKDVFAVLVTRLRALLDKKDPL